MQSTSFLNIFRDQNVEIPSCFESIMEMKRNGFEDEEERFMRMRDDHEHEHLEARNINMNNGVAYSRVSNEAEAESFHGNANNYSQSMYPSHNVHNGSNFVPFDGHGNRQIDSHYEIRN